MPHIWPQGGPLRPRGGPRGPNYVAIELVPVPYPEVAEPGWMAEMAEIMEPALGLDEVSGSSSLRFYAGTSTSPQCLTYYNRQRGWCACAGVEAQRAPSG